jgi:flagellar basal-body rod protein FlgF
MLDRSFHVGISSQLATARRLSSIAENVANAGTIGFRADSITFKEMKSNADATPLSFVKPGGIRLSETSGPLVPTGNPLDLAVRGNAWLSVEYNGQTVYTKDGRLTVAADGSLRTMLGAALLDSAGSPLSVTPNDGPITVSTEGDVFQNKRLLGRIGLWVFPDNSMLQRAGPSAVTSTAPAESVQNRAGIELVSGYIEQANVDAVASMTNLISVSRTFQGMATAIDTLDNLMRSAIDKLSTK